MQRLLRYMHIVYCVLYYVFFRSSGQMDRHRVDTTRARQSTSTRHKCCGIGRTREGTHCLQGYTNTPSISFFPTALHPPLKVALVGCATNSTAESSRALPNSAVRSKLTYLCCKLWILTGTHSFVSPAAPKSTGGFGVSCVSSRMCG